MPRLQPGGFTNKLRRLLYKAQAAIEIERGSCTKKALAEWIGITPGVLYRFMRYHDTGVSSGTVDKIAYFFAIEVPVEYQQRVPLRKRLRKVA